MSCWPTGCQHGFSTAFRGRLPLAVPVGVVEGGAGAVPGAGYQATVYLRGARSSPSAELVTDLNAMQAKAGRVGRALRE